MKHAEPRDLTECATFAELSIYNEVPDFVDFFTAFKQRIKNMGVCAREFNTKEDYGRCKFSAAAIRRRHFSAHIKGVFSRGDAGHDARRWGGRKLWWAMMVGRHPREGTTEESHGVDAAGPSELLAPLLEEWRDVLVKHVLAWLDPEDFAMLAQVGKPWLAVVVANKLPRAGKEGAVPLVLSHFVGSIERLAWAKANGCPWETRTCTYAAAGGQLEVLQWAREHGCPWFSMTCARAAAGGHLGVLKWAREHHFPWNVWTCAAAAAGGHLEVLRWARDNGCPWNANDCERVAEERGHVVVAQWVRA
jgi:hypothetical protein